MKESLEFAELNPITKQDLMDKKNELGLQAVAETSSKEWEDFNVHKAFVTTIETGLQYKNL